MQSGSYPGEDDIVRFEDTGLADPALRAPAWFQAGPKQPPKRAGIVGPRDAPHRQVFQCSSTPSRVFEVADEVGGHRGQVPVVAG